MTTIATDGKVMAADQAVGSDCLHALITKLQRAKDGAILGGCGQAFDYAGFLAWYDDGCEGKPNVSKDFEGLILKTDGTIICVDEEGRSFAHPAPACIGSGTRFAYGALDAGVDPKKAVEIAIGRDGASSGVADVMTPGEARLKAVG